MQRGFAAAVLLALVPAALPVYAQDADSYSLFSLLVYAPEFEQTYTTDLQPIWYSSIENDALTGKNITDEYYTNAMRVSELYNIEQGFLYDNLRLYGFVCSGDEGAVDDSCDLPTGRQSNRDLKLVTYGYTVGHQMYTPYEDAGKGYVSDYGYEHLSNALYYDRPFAAWAFYGKDLTIAGIDGYQQHEFSWGVVGPSAKGRWMQEKAHEYPFTGPTPIDGWESQVEDRLALQYSGKFAYHLWQQPLLFGDSRISHFALIEAGTIINRIGYGAEAAISWPRMENCERYAASEMVNLSFAAKDNVSARLRLLDARRALKTYRDGHNYIPDRAYLRTNALIDHIERQLDKGADEDSQLRLLAEVEQGINEMNGWLRDSVLKSCRHDSFYTRLSADSAVHYVISNYLLEGGIHVPAGTDPSSSNAVMRDGGVLEVARKPVIFSASFGVRVGYDDVMALDLRYKYRSEETIEQMESHAWAEMALEVKNDAGMWAIPALLVLAAWHNQDNWPE